MNADDLDAAVTEMLRLLIPFQDRDWTVRAGDLDWDCLTTAAHVAHDLTAYATQLATDTLPPGLKAPTARADGSYLPLDLTVRPDTSPRTVLQIVGSAARLLSLALRAAGPEARAWHWGPTDRSGFAALGVNETLAHTWDVAQGLRLDWTPPPAPAARVLSRLFPDAPPGDPSAVLLWCTGRVALPGHPRRTDWKVKAALTR
ncbi:hypothetical protein Q0Z83_010140 [Actinoplanes sichuanensis]|uniref:Maleylpyruvate isomerase N-terminal domain-containing protein n=1 Tax=Actinoplanes sichuanensis TaxID=512349 RepID=A0ABW4A6P1_9ACTN|nr:maleylpyruvate isomerase N-terminal domain-containing protein [Actinoplanes sichuanensis]BEL02823.1 hypothetical protein Q0Z83_010140 [Actinoplanes sichuanensis]